MIKLTDEEVKALKARAKLLRLIWEKAAPPDPVDKILIKIARQCK